MVARSVSRSVRIGRCLLCAASVLLGGCLSSKYRSAPKDTPPAPALNVDATDSELGATVESIVIFHGPGSWKRNAYWDEYVVTVTNVGTAPVVLESATLVGIAERRIAPSTDPWTLERDSKAAAKENFWLPPGSGPQIGGGVTAFSISVGAGAVFGASISGGFVSAGTGALIGGAVLAVAAAPVVGGATLYRNAIHRSQIAREFNERRLRLPVTLGPGERIRGSLFFVITPAPRELRFEYRTHGGANSLAVDVTKAGPLHLQLKPSTVAVDRSVGK